MFRQWFEQNEAWTATKDEILSLWKSLKDRPIRPNPIPYYHKGTTYGQDAIRITGTGDFINSVLGRVKDLMYYESPGTNLDVSYEQMVDKSDQPVPGKYVCYIKVRQREPKGV